VGKKHNLQGPRPAFRTSKERREFKRLARTFSIKELRPKQVTRHVVSISLSGMYIKTHRPYKAGTLAVFEIQVDEAGRKVIAPAWVVRCDEQAGMAFEFMAPQLEFSSLLGE